MKLTNQRYEQVYKEIKHLSTKIRGFYSLDEQERSIATNNAFMYLIKKMEDGKVPSDDYESYKGYLFITIRNSVLQRFYKERRKFYYLYLNDIEYGDDYEEINKNKEFDEKPKLAAPNENEFDRIILDLNMLTPYQKGIFRWRQRGWQVSYIAYATNISKTTIRKHLNKITAILKQQVI